jgi:hypothetical protein
VPQSARQYIELFHLVFLRAVSAKGENKSLFALKGGCNLRFFFRSLRYSEDIDVAIVAKDTLKNKLSSIHSKESSSTNEPHGRPAMQTIVIARLESLQ